MACFYESSYLCSGSETYGSGSGSGDDVTYPYQVNSSLTILDRFESGAGRNQNTVYAFSGLFVHEKFMPSGTIDYFVSDLPDQVGRGMPRKALHDHYRLHPDGSFETIHTRWTDAWLRSVGREHEITRRKRGL